jgi:hypothetical protein
MKVRAWWPALVRDVSTIAQERASNEALTEPETESMNEKE